MVHRNIHTHLNKVHQQDNQYGGVNGILALSYNDLLYYLKPCFLYLAHYPEDSEITKKEVIRLWISEGFISPPAESEGMLEDVAEQFLEELINRCLVQVGKRDHTGIDVKTCRIHDLLRELCMVKAREEKFLEIIQPPLVENHGDSLDVTSSASMVRRIAIHPSKRYVCLEGEPSKLRSLLLFQNEKLIELHISKCKNFKFLRVLKVVGRDVVKWNVSSEISNLHHLRYLSLVCFKGQITLPPSILGLKSLHTLEVGSHGLKLPPNILFLERLRHILLIDYRGFFFGAELCLPPRFTSKNIETLKYIRVRNLLENNAVFNLPNIRTLGMIFESPKDVEPMLNALIELHRLQSVKIRLLLDLVLSNKDLEPLSQCLHLSILFLEGKIEEDPHSIQHDLKFVPANIVKLSLHSCEVKEDPMAVLEKLPCLRILKLLYNSYKGTKLNCSINGFLQLDFLELGSLHELEEWEIEEGAMPRIRDLHLTYLSNLRMFPEGLRYLTTLQEMELYGMKRPLIERIEVKDGREGDDFSKVSHIPSIQITHTQDD